MYGISLRTALLCVVLTAALSFTGCGLQVRSITLVKGIEVPTQATIKDESDPGWIEYLNGQDYELNEQFCDLDKFQEELEKALPEFLAKRVRVRSVRVVTLEFTAEEGNFDSIKELDSILSVNDNHYSFYSGIREDGMGTSVKLRPKPRLNLADAVNDAACVNTYLRIAGTLPEEALRFNIVLNYRLRLGFSLF